MAEILRMYNRELNAAGDTTQEAYDLIYAARGWELLSPVASAATEILGRPVAEVGDLTISEARQVLASVGVAALPSALDREGVLQALTDRFSDDPVVAAAVVSQPEPVERPRYDPSNYVVRDVQEYLEICDEAEFDRVIALEREGQARKGILEFSKPA